MSRKFATWAGKSCFEYDGCVKTGTVIHFGKDGKWKQRVTAEQYACMLRHFGGSTVDIGTSRDNPPEGSVGEWLQAHVCKTAIASYVGAILVAEKYACRVYASKIQFTRREVS